MRIDTRPGTGTTVNVYLPRANGDVSCVMPTQPRADPETSDFRRVGVLVVDDDSEVRAALVEMLRYAGHDVVEAASGREALNCVDQRGDRIDLVILDYVMPDMNGVEVARLGQLKRPGLPILFITGFADTAVVVAKANSHHILQKPFYTSDLVVIGSTRHIVVLCRYGTDSAPVNVSNGSK